MVHQQIANKLMNYRRYAIALLSALLLSTLLFLDFTDKDDPVIHVAVDMLWFLALGWVLICGSIMYLLQDKFYALYVKIKWPFWLKFTVFALLFSMVEEAVAVTINNVLSPRSGGIAKLTVSTDYLEVVTQHSIVALLPLFIIFGLLIPKFKLTQFQTFLLFGLVGVLAEYTVTGGIALVLFSLWIFVYGLMVYLPARYESTIDPIKNT